MTATLARIAGCPEVAAFTPSGPGGRSRPTSLPRSTWRGNRGLPHRRRAGRGRDGLWDRTIPAVDKIFGPGNAYVCEAKRQVFGTVGVDLLPGPSEVMVIADGSARPITPPRTSWRRPSTARAGRRSTCRDTSAASSRAVAAEIERQLGASRAPRRRAGPRGRLPCDRGPEPRRGRRVVANRVAPEHLELLVGDPGGSRACAKITTAGAIMIGNARPRPRGLCRGPEPRASRPAGPALLKRPARRDFLRRTSVLATTEEPPPGRADGGRPFGDGELDAHGRSARDPGDARPAEMSGAPPGELALAHVAGSTPTPPASSPREPGWVKLNTNECPYPPSPRVAEAILREVGPDGASLGSIPTRRARRCGPRWRGLHGLARQVCIGNGSDDILNLLVRCFCGPAAAAGFTLPSYSLYPVLVGIQDGGSRRSPRPHACACRSRGSRPRAPGSSSSPRPNAPTGVGFPQFRDRPRSSILPGHPGRGRGLRPLRRENAAGLLAAHPNLVIVRTLSKAYALAGIRVGYALADARGDRPPGPGPRQLQREPALAGGGARRARRPGYYAGRHRGQDQGHKGLLRMTVGRKRGWFTFPREANFICTEPRDARAEPGPAVAKAAYDFPVLAQGVGAPLPERRLDRLLPADQRRHR
jgi:histidinol-phosphate aminotransferase